MNCGLEAEVIEDKEALELMKKYNSFNGKTPRFLLNAGVIVPNE